MINLRQTADLRAQRPDISVGIPQIGVGLQWFPKHTNYPSILAHTFKAYGMSGFDDPYDYGTLDAELRSNHVTGSIFVPVANGSGDNLTVEVPSSALPLNISLGKYTFGNPAADPPTFNVSSGSSPNKIITTFDSVDFTPPNFGGTHTHALVANAGSVSTGFVNAADTPAPGNFYQIRLISKRGSSPALFAHLNGRQSVAVDTTGDGSANLAAFVLPSGYTHYSDVIWGLAFVKNVLSYIFGTAGTDGAGTNAVTSNDIAGIVNFMNTEPGVCFYGGDGDGGSLTDTSTRDHLENVAESVNLDMGPTLVDWQDIHTGSSSSYKAAGGSSWTQQVAQTGLFGGFGGGQYSQPINLKGTCHAPIPGTTANVAAGVVAEDAGIAYLHVQSKDTGSTGAGNALHLILTPNGVSTPSSSAIPSGIQRFEQVQQTIENRSRVEVPLTAHSYGSAGTTGDLSNIFQFYWTEPSPGAADISFTFTDVVDNGASIKLIDNGHSNTESENTVNKTFEVQSSSGAGGGRTKIDTDSVTTVTQMAQAFCAAVNSEYTLDIRASNIAGAVTLTQGYQGTSGGGTLDGDTTISFPDIGSGTTEAAWNAAVSGSMPTAFTGGATDSNTTKYKTVKVHIQGWKLNG